MKYLITYDLNKTGQNYDGLIKAIKNYRFVHPLESVWFIKTEKSSEVVSSELLKFIDSNDRLFVCEINQNRQGWLSKSDWDFLNTN